MEERTMEKQSRETAPAPESLREYYSDVVWVAVNEWTSAVTFGQRGLADGEQNRQVVRVRMAPIQAKVLGLLLTKTVRQYEETAHVRLELSQETLGAAGLKEMWAQAELAGHDSTPKAEGNER